MRRAQHRALRRRSLSFTPGGADRRPRVFDFARGIERGDDINETLTLRVVDSVDGELDVLAGCAVWVSSRYD